MKVYNINNVVTIEGVTSGDPQNFVAEHSGDNVSIYNTKNSLYEVFNNPYTDFEDFNGNTYASSMEVHAYLELVFTSNTQKVALNSEDNNGVSLISIQKPQQDFDTLVTPNFAVDGTDFEVKPSAGEYIDIIKAEAQFEHDLNISGITKFYLDYYVWYDHPTYGQIETIGITKEFDSVRALFELGNEHYHSPAIGTEMPTGLTTISFSYPSKLKLHGDFSQLELSKLVCRLDKDGSDNPILPIGSYVTIGFVTTSGSL